VMTARLSQTPVSSGCETVHGHSQSCRAQTAALRQLISTARTAGSLVNFSNASAVTAAVRSAHSAAPAAAACQAATSCRTGLSPAPVTTPIVPPSQADDQHSYGPAWAQAHLVHRAERHT